MKYTQNQLTKFSQFFEDNSQLKLPLKLENYSDPIELYKKGHKIRIKKENRGKFTEYCGGNVTDACIQKGKNSPDPKIRKRATFAANARTQKHVQKHGVGGLIKSLRPLLGKVLSVSKVPESYFNFDKNFYFAHGTHPSVLQSIMNKGLYCTGRTHQTTTLPVYNLETVDKLIFNTVNKGKGNHHNAQGMVFLEIPKTTNKPHFQPDDLYDVLSKPELESFLKDGYLPTRFNLFAVDGSRIF